MRLHLCWGNYEGPHHLDVPLRDIIDLVLRARPAGISFEGANPRHEHEWKIWKDGPAAARQGAHPGRHRLRRTNFIEHPEVVSDRIVRYANVVGRESVIAGTDCGFGTFADNDGIDPRIAWAEARRAGRGARRATDELWSRRASGAA